MPRTLAATLLICLLCLALAPAAPASGNQVVLLAPAKTRVGLARVNLEVLDLHMQGSDRIVGTYEIKIPLAPWRNDRGEISLHAPESLEQLTADGGTLSGSGLSEDGRMHPIVCAFEADGFVAIRVTTPDRDLDFRTRYELVGN